MGSWDYQTSAASYLFSSSVMQTTSRTPGLLAFSTEQLCRFQVATLSTGLPSLSPPNISTDGRVEMIWVGPPGGKSKSSLWRLSEVGLG